MTLNKPVVWCKVVVVAPALVRRDGRVQVAGRPCDHARLGAAEVELDARCGPGTIEALAAGVTLRPGGKVKAVARREMSIAFTIRVVLAMTLMPEADTREVMSALLGDLSDLPWRRPHPVPSTTVLSTWRAAIAAAPLVALQRMLLEAVVAEHRALPPTGSASTSPSARSTGSGGSAHPVEGIEVGGGLRVGSLDGSVTRMPDTGPNREAFGTAGAADAGYPQVRHLHACDAFTRATLAAVTGPAGGDKGEAEQVLLDRMLVENAGVFGPDRLWVMDRNLCATRRLVTFPAQLGGTGGMFLGPWLTRT